MDQEEFEEYTELGRKCPDTTIDYSTIDSKRFKEIYDELKLQDDGTFKGRWKCPKELQNNEGKCNAYWNCTIPEWQEWCSGEMKWATAVTTSKPKNVAAWLVGVVALGINLTCDIFEHLVVMRQAPHIFKLLLVL